MAYVATPTRRSNIGSTSVRGSMSIDTTELKLFAKVVRSASPAASRHMREKLREIGEIVADRARSKASWSTRIPGSIKVRTTGVKLSVVAGGDAAPHARVYEMGSQRNRSMVRHPVFGNRQVWAQNPTRPFLLPALRDVEPEIMASIVQVIEETAAEIGF
jgi:hypothetical protein